MESLYGNVARKSNLKFKKMDAFRASKNINKSKIKYHKIALKLFISPTRVLVALYVIIELIHISIIIIITIMII